MKTTIHTTMGEHSCSRYFSWATLLLIAAALLSGCGGGSSGGGIVGSSDTVVDSEITVTETLEALNIDPNEKPLVDEFLNVIPDDYSPLGPQFELNKVDELVVVGLMNTEGSGFSLWDLEDLNPDSPEILRSALWPWSFEMENAQGSKEQPLSLREGIGADLDGDGLEEQFYLHPNMITGKWEFTIIEDDVVGGSTTSYYWPSYGFYYYDICLAAADINGDGDQEIVVGTSYYTSYDLEAQLTVYDYVNGQLLALPFTKTFYPQHQGDMLPLEITSGNIDYDPEDELGVVVNEVLWSTWSRLGCDSYVLDVDGTHLTEKYAGAITAEGYLALSGDVAMGDLDADGMDEIVFAGSPPTASMGSVRYALVSLDDAVHGLEMKSKFMEHELEGGMTHMMDTMPQVGLVDFEGDRACEVHVNSLIFHDWKSHDPWSKYAELNDFYIPNKVQYWNTATFAFAVGDFTGPDFTDSRRQDLAVVARGFNKVSIWGIAGANPDIRVLKEIPLTAYDENTKIINPRLISVNSDVDSTILEFVEHEYVLTEPVILAVMAAAPSITGPGQNKGAHLTEFGTKQGHGSGSEGHFTFTAGFIVGSDWQAPGHGLDIEIDLGFELEKTSFTNSKVSFGAGYGADWQDDTVVCACVPYDIYRYRVLKDPDPNLIGTIYEVTVPRTPVTGIHEIGFYNAAVDSEAVRIDDDVLQHQIGNPYSYPSALDRDKLIVDEGGNKIGLYDPKLVSAGGPQGGQATREINVISESGGTLYTGGTFNVSFKTTVSGFKVGGRYGFGGGHTWSWSVENENSYFGTVGCVDEENYPEKVFSWGLFCYWRKDPETGHRYQVINYWVE